MNSRRLAILLCSAWLAGSGVSAERVSATVAETVAAAHIGHFFAGTWQSAATFTLYGDDGHPSAYAIVFQLTTTKPAAFDLAAIRRDIAAHHTHLRDLQARHEQTIRRPHESPSAQAHRADLLRQAMRTRRNAMTGAGTFATVVTGAATHHVLIKKCYRGLPAFLVDEPRVREIAAGAFGGETPTLGRVFYLGPFDLYREIVPPPSKAGRSDGSAPPTAERLACDPRTERIVPLPAAPAPDAAASKRAATPPASLTRPSLWAHYSRLALSSGSDSAALLTPGKTVYSDPVVVAENSIPGATDSPSSVPAYRNSQTLYPLPPHSGGICFATAISDILAYWDRTPYQGITYWNLVDHGTAPLLQDAIPTSPGHQEGDIRTVVTAIGNAYYNDDTPEIEYLTDAKTIIEGFCNNDSNGLAFVVETYPEDDGTSKLDLFRILQEEIDHGRPARVDSKGNYFGGPHTVPAIGYREFADPPGQSLFIHRNTGGIESEYCNVMASDWGTLWISTIHPGGTPVDHYEDDNTPESASPIDPDDVFGFRQTHNFHAASTKGEADTEDWVTFYAEVNKRYTIATEALGPNCDTQLFLDDGDATQIVDDDSGAENGASRIVWNCPDVSRWITVRVTEAFGRTGHDTNYDLTVSAVDAAAPVTPTPTAPADDSATTDTTPTFEWTAFVSGDDGDTAAGYQLRVYSVNEAQRIVYDTGFVADVSAHAHTYTPGAYAEFDALTGMERISEPLQEGNEYHWRVRCRDSSGDWSGWSTAGDGGPQSFHIDLAGPPAPVISSPTHPHSELWYADFTPTFAWETPYDPAGVVGYSIALDTSATTVPDTVVNTTSNAKTYLSLSDGTWYFHIRAKDGLGNWGPAGHFAVGIDTVAPAAPTIASSTHPHPGTWYANDSPVFSWPEIADTSGIAGYSVVIDHADHTLPDTVVDGTADEVAFHGLADGFWTVHVRAVDRAGNWGDAGHCSILVDTSPPPAPDVECSSHPLAHVWYADNTLTFTWTSPSDASGISGFSYVLDQIPSTVPDTVAESPATTVSVSGQPDGIWYFHIRARDGAGNWGAPNHVHARVDCTAPVLTVIPETIALAYGDPEPDLLAGVSANDAATGLLTDRVQTHGSVDVWNPGEYLVEYTVADDAGNQAPAAQRLYTVTKATLIVRAQDRSRVYGEPNPTWTLTFDGFVGTDGPEDLQTPPTVHCNATEDSLPGEYEIAVSGGTDDHYSYVHAPGVLTITKALLTVSAVSRTKIYGEPNPPFPLTYAGFLNDHTSADLDLPPEAACTADHTSIPGTYPITPGGGVDEIYAFTFESAVLTIEPAALQCTADHKSRFYGDPNPAFTLTFAGLVNDDTAESLEVPPTVDCVAGIGSAAGAYAIVPAGGNDSRYIFSYVEGVLTIDPTPLQCTPQNKERLYGSENPAVTIVYEGLKNNDPGPRIPPAASCPAAAGSDVGTYPITLSGGSDPNYALLLGDGALTVLPAPLLCTAENKTKRYGEENPPLTIVYTGLRNDDTPDDLDTPPAISCPADPTSKVGVYPIRLENGADMNYAFDYVYGMLTVNRAVLSCSADNRRRFYGDPNPTFTMTFEGFVNADDQGGLGTLPQIACGADARSAAGEYAILLSGGHDRNYSFEYIPGILTVDPAALLCTADDLSRAYGDDNPDLTITYTGLKNDDPAPAVPPEATCPADRNSPPGDYPVTLNGGADPNYVISLADGRLTIAHRALTIRADDRQRLYGDDNPEWTVSFSGFADGDDVTVLDSPPRAACSATVSSDTGIYPIVPYGAADSCYEPQYVNGTLTIDPAPLTCTAHDANKLAGEPLPPFTLSYAGLRNADTGPMDPPAISCNANRLSPAGTYPIVLTGGSDPNYSLELIDGSLRVLQGAFMTLEVSAGERSIWLHFGEAENASDALDPEWDVEVSAGPVGEIDACFVNAMAGDENAVLLTRDFRACAQLTRWCLDISGLAARAAVSLTWDVSPADESRALYLQRIIDEAPVGFPLDMRGVSSLEITENTRFEIAYAVHDEVKLPLRRGWNLVGSPLMSISSADRLINGDAGSHIRVGQIWTWQDGRYQCWNPDLPLSPERAFWIYCPSTRESTAVSGIVADGVMLLQPGWNAITPTADSPMPSTEELSSPAWYYDSALRSYLPATPGSTLRAGVGYWMHVHSAVPIMVHLGN